MMPVTIKIITAILIINYENQRQYNSRFDIRHCVHTVTECEEVKRKLIFTVGKKSLKPLCSLRTLEEAVLYKGTLLLKNSQKAIFAIEILRI